MPWLKLLFELLKVLHEDFPMAVLVIIHRNAKYETNIEENMGSKCRISIKAAQEKEILDPSNVYFAPAGYHLLIEPDRSISLDVSEPVHFCRPSIDVTMQSVAEVYGEKCIAILLSGANQDGAQGMMTIKQMGGICVIQDPEDAEVKTMPESAIAIGAMDLILGNLELLEFVGELNKSN